MYTIEEILYFRDIRYLGFDQKNEFQDDNYTTPSADFFNETNLFLDWLSKMEKRGKLKEFLNDEKLKAKVKELLN